MLKLSVMESSNLKILLKRTATTTSREDIQPSETSFRDVASRAAKERCDAGFGVGETGLAVYLDFAAAIKRLGEKAIEKPLRKPLPDV